MINPISPVIARSLSRAFSSRTRIPGKCGGQSLPDRLKGLTLFSTKLDSRASEIRFGQQNGASISQNSRLAEEELLVMDDTILPTSKEYGFGPIHQPSFFLHDVNRITPEMSNGFNDRLSAVNYPAMAAVVDGQ